MNIIIFSQFVFLLEYSLSKDGPTTNRVGIFWELVSNVDSQAPFRPTESGSAIEQDFR